MKKTGLFFAVAVAAMLLLAAASEAAARSASNGRNYRIVVRDGSVVLAKDRPVHRGSVVLFHRYPDGLLTSLPEEAVWGFARNATLAHVRFVRPLQPGEAVDVGVTASPGNSQAPTPIVYVDAAAPLPGGVYDPRNPLYGFAPSGAMTGTNLNGAAVNAIPPGDLARAISTSPPTATAPLPGSPTTPIGPNGTPNLNPNAPPQTIGPNGTPILAPPGGPGSTPPATGPNGTPVLAPKTGSI